MKGEILSSGGGTQSAAIIAMIVRGELPKPDLAVIADTGREASETWRYHDEVLAPALCSVGVEYVRLPHHYHPEKGPRKEGQWNTVDIYSGKDGDTVIMPMLTKQTGKPGMMPKFCSNEWKTRPLERFIKWRGFTHGHIWIGFSADEMERMRRYDQDKKWNQVYPLIDKRMRRFDSIRLVESMGWPTPPRSACWMCPYRSDAEWLHLKNQNDGDFEKAVRLEKSIQAKDPNAFFHDSCKPLEEVDLNDAQDDLFSKPCASGMCFT